MLKDSRERFTETAPLYHRYRPGYPDALVDWMLERAALRPPATVIDVGCGTGIATRLFVARGFRAIGVDPNEEMLAYARSLGGARYVRGEAAATGLRGASADLVIVAQAFHWFDVPVALAEFARILRPGSSCAAFWNLRAEGPLLDEYECLLRQASVEYEGLPKPWQTLDRIRASAGVEGISEAEFHHVQRLDREGFFGRVHSSSYVAHGLRDPATFHRALDEMFDRHQRDGHIDIEYRAVALLWRFAVRA